jgi:hypothetical protein
VSASEPDAAVTVTDAPELQGQPADGDLSGASARTATAIRDEEPAVATTVLPYAEPPGGAGRW